jgi:hypothetical protein
MCPTCRASTPRTTSTAAQSAPRCRGEAADLHQLSDRHRLAWPQGLGGLDGYIINVNNKIATDTDTTASGALVNIGSVHYKGVEGQVAYMPIEGLTLFANGSYNYAHSGTTGAQIAKAPFSTAAAGFIYNHKGCACPSARSSPGRNIATELSTVTASSNGTPTAITQYSTLDGVRLYRISPYSTGEFAISQELGQHLRPAPPCRTCSTAARSPRSATPRTSHRRHRAASFPTRPAMARATSSASCRRARSWWICASNTDPFRRKGAEGQLSRPFSMGARRLWHRMRLPAMAWRWSLPVRRAGRRDARPLGHAARARRRRPM